MKKLTLALILCIILFAGYKLLTIPKIVAPGEAFPSLGQQHVQPESPEIMYNSNPPTSGPHYLVPAPSGIYDTEFPDRELIHNIEHGHIWISYKPDLSKDQVEQLVAIAKSYGTKIIVAPRTKNDSPIAIAAWQHLLKLSAVDETQIKAFINALQGHGPESVPDSGFKDFRTPRSTSSIHTL